MLFFCGHGSGGGGHSGDGGHDGDGGGRGADPGCSGWSWRSEWCSFSAFVLYFFL